MTIEFTTAHASQITPAEEDAILDLVRARLDNHQSRHLAALEALGRAGRHDAGRVMLLIDIARVVQSAVVLG